jgi:Protein of unknown function (DUF3485)
MKSTTQKFLWALLAIAVFVGLIWQFYPMPDAGKRLHALPLQGPGFIGQDEPLTEFELNFFKNANVVKRIYRVDHENYFVTVLDGTKDRHLVHDPYYCFTGSGWNIISKKRLSLVNGDAETLIISKGTHEKSAIFWFSNGKSTYASPLEYWWEATLRRLTLGWSGQEPVLVMIQPLDTVTDVDWKKVTGILDPLTAL